MKKTETSSGKKVRKNTISKAIRDHVTTILPLQFWRSSPILKSCRCFPRGVSTSITAPWTIWPESKLLCLGAQQNYKSSPHLRAKIQISEVRWKLDSDLNLCWDRLSRGVKASNWKLRPATAAVLYSQQLRNLLPCPTPCKEHVTEMFSFLHCRR